MVICVPPGPGGQLQSGQRGIPRDHHSSSEGGRRCVCLRRGSTPWEVGLTGAFGGIWGLGLALGIPH